MKKLYQMLLLALPLVFFAACDDDDKLPDVSINVNIEGATRVDDVLYVVKGETITVESVTLTDNTEKGAVIGGVDYYWDYRPVGATIVQPYTIELNTDGVPVGNHLLQINMSIYAVDYSTCWGRVYYKVKIVESSDDIPTTGDVEQNPTVPAHVTSEKPVE